MAIVIREDTLTPALRQFDERAKAGIALGMKWGESRVEQHARSNAKWTDRTGNARNGLTGRYVENGDEHKLVLFHRMPYGIWLETRFSGKFAIIMPTLRAIRGELLRVVAASVQRSVQGGR